MKNLITSLIFTTMFFSTVFAQDRPRYDGTPNVFWDGNSSLYCFWTNDLIRPDRDGNYNVWTATNENPTPRFIQNIGYLTVYKFKDYDACLRFCNWKRKDVGLPLLSKDPKYSGSNATSKRTMPKQISQKTVTTVKKCKWCGNSIQGKGFTIKGTQNGYGEIIQPLDYCTRKCAADARN